MVVGATRNYANGLSELKASGLDGVEASSAGAEFGENVEAGVEAGFGVFSSTGSITGGVDARVPGSIVGMLFQKRLSPRCRTFIVRLGLPS